MLVPEIGELVLSFSDLLYDSYDLVPKIGLEIEFYLLSNGNPASETQIEEFLELTTKYSCHKEKGKSQLEIKYIQTTNILHLSSIVEKDKRALIAVAESIGLDITFESKPFIDDYGSALQISISLINQEGENIFDTQKIEENEILLESIAGILDISREAMYLICKEHDFGRFVPKTMAPVNVSWGVNNRTTLVRVPESQEGERRLEFRLPPASADMLLSTLVVIIGVIHGLKEKPKLPERIFGNAYDEQYALQKLPESFIMAKTIFEERKILKSYIEKINAEE